jgi:hypothetical protein
MSRAPIIAALLTVITASVAEAGGSHLIAVSRPARGSTHVAYESTDAGAGLAKGGGADPAAIAVEVFLGDENGTTRYVVPAGAFAGGAGWVANDAVRASYLNQDAPGGPTGVRRLLLVVGRRAKLVAESLGDVSPLAFGAPPSADVALACVVTNGTETATHCTRFAPADCAYTPLDGTTGWKLRCRNGVADLGCGAIPTTTTTSSTLPPGVCGNGIRESGEECDGGPACTGCQQSLPSCCAQPTSCIDAPLFSLQFYLMNYCSVFSPGSTPVPGGLCTPDGTCASRPIDPVPVCCQQATACYDGTSMSTADLWFFNYSCNSGAGIGMGPYIVVNATCGAGGTCVPL